MADEETVKYRLYALNTSAKNFEYARKQRFQRANGEYILVYTTDEKPKGALEISADQIDLLSTEEAQWIWDNNIAILAEETEKRQPEVIRSLSERIEILEEELKKRKDELEGKEQ